ncbi:MAG TPA: CHAT domain-containing protein, partial [Gemmataceae bacterium]|nr:CHAT domain-containing protein [Gemmataceae bacterium]
AATHARLANPSAAWLAAEANLARGLNDEIASRRIKNPKWENSSTFGLALNDEKTTRHGSDLTADEQEKWHAILARLAEIELKRPPVTKQSLSDAERDDLAKLLEERRHWESRLVELGVTLSKRQLVTLDQVQGALPVDGALVLWVDETDLSRRLHEHWGCVVRRRGDPAWERLPGSGLGGSWSEDDSAMPKKLTTAYAGTGSPSEIARLAQQLFAQRISPLQKHLDGITRLFVVPVDAMAGVPVEALGDNYTVSYVPSGAFLVWLKERQPPSGSSLLALGDPVFQVEPPLNIVLPPHGLLIAKAVPGGNGERAGLRPGDVLLAYAGAALTSFDTLTNLMQQHARDKVIDATVWHEAESHVVKLPPGKLGVVFDPEPAPKAIAAKRKAEVATQLARLLGSWKELPGTAVEVARLSKLVPDGQAVTLTRSEASEQELGQLSDNGKLAQFRYLHFATHGAVNNFRSFESALILAQDQISFVIPDGVDKYYTAGLGRMTRVFSMKDSGGAPYYIMHDGRLKANEVLSWRLDNAELVTLSACESALGRPGGGDGLLGFAQAFLLAGARAVCLSLWKVDDTATALLMDRFYQNLLGTRDGLSQPLGKAAALAEAKRWLRNLSLDDATKFAADLAHSVARGNNELALKLVVPTSEPVAAIPNDRPFSHPRYWAAFVLIGDPD